MSNNFFRFKQFTIYQDRCAMKVGTDGVLLGAWTDVSMCNSVLDVGTGTGLLSLMIAQRSNDVIIDAIDIDRGCVLQAQDNVRKSPFYNRISVKELSFQEVVYQKNKRYDLIVSNPPYFQNSLKSPNVSRNYARHTDMLSFYDIISESTSLLTENGMVSLILPYEFKENVLTHAVSENLFVHRITNVHSLPHKPAGRLLVEFGKIEKQTVSENNLVIENSRHKYTNDFDVLTNQFYLSK